MIKKFLALATLVSLLVPAMAMADGSINLGLFNPMIRELKEMIYQFEIPFIVDDSEYKRVFGDVTATPSSEGVKQTVAWYREYVVK